MANALYPTEEERKQLIAAAIDDGKFKLPVEDIKWEDVSPEEYNKTTFFPGVQAGIRQLINGKFNSPETIGKKLIGNNELLLTDQNVPTNRIQQSFADLHPVERMQAWPEVMARSATTLPGEVLSGKVPVIDPATGHTSEDVIQRVQDVAGLAGGGMLFGKAGESGAVVGSGPVKPKLTPVEGNPFEAGGTKIVSDTAEPGAAIAGLNNSSKFFLRPALKYEGKVYKAPVNGQHQDAIPANLRSQFEQMAMSGEDISHFNFGFLNHKGHFLNRDDALRYAIDNGLVDPHNARYGALTSTMFSDTNSGAPLSALAKNAKPFYSAVEHQINQIQQPKMTGEQWLGTLANKPGVKPEELQWTGLQDFLKERGNQPVTKAEVQEHLANNKVELKEVNKGEKNPDYDRWRELDNKAIKTPEEKAEYERLTYTSPNIGLPKYQKYQLPGGENYREMLMTLPEIKTKKPYEQWLKENFTGMDNQQARDLYEIQQEPGANYNSSHWDEPNILAHVRMNDRTLPAETETIGQTVKRVTGKEWDEFSPKEQMEFLNKDWMNANKIEGKPQKVLHLEEIQSDWHQQGRDKGYKNPEMPIAKRQKEIELQLNAMKDKAPENIRNKAVESSEWAEKNFPEYSKLRDELFANQKLENEERHGVPNAPFKKTWHELALKRMIREAAEKGYDRLSWTPGEAQAARYDLSKSVDKIAVPMVNENGTRSVRIDAKSDTPFKLMVDKNGIVDGAHSAAQFSGKHLSDVIGKEMADKIMKLEKPNEFSGDGLKIGGEGMKGFYDQIIPKAIEKIGKEHGVKVKQGRINVDPTEKARSLDEFRELADEHSLNDQGVMERYAPIHYIDIPQSLKDQALHKGFPLFSGGLMFTPVDGNPWENK